MNGLANCGTRLNPAKIFWRYIAERWSRGEGGKKDPGLRPLGPEPYAVRGKVDGGSAVLDHGLLTRTDSRDDAHIRLLLSRVLGPGGVFWTFRSFELALRPFPAGLMFPGYARSQPHLGP